MTRGRSINLALSVRGITALKGTGVDLSQIMGSMIPMKGRMIHSLTGAQTSQNYGVHGEVKLPSFQFPFIFPFPFKFILSTLYLSLSLFYSFVTKPPTTISFFSFSFGRDSILQNSFHQCINSIDRKKLNEALVTAGEQFPNLHYHFEYSLISCDLDTKVLMFQK